MRRKQTENKRKRNNRKTLRKLYKGGGSRMHYYIEPTLGISKEEFLDKLPSIMKIQELGRGVYGAAQLALLDGTKLVIKEIHMNLPKLSINNYIAHPGKIRDPQIKIMMVELLNEAQALEELVNNETTRNYVPPFVGLLVSDIFELRGGGKNNMKRALSMENLSGNNENNSFRPLMISLPRGSPGSNEGENEEHDNLYFISKYIPGDTLFNVLNRNPDLLSGDIVHRINADFTNALHAIHNAGWIHCDIHSKNLYIETDDANNYKGVRILDFGKALRIGSGVIKNTSYTPWVPEDDIKALDSTMQTVMGALSNNDESVVSNNNENMFGENQFNEAAAEKYLRNLHGAMPPPTKRARLNTNTTRVNSRIVNTNNFNTRRRKIPVGRK